MPVSEDACKRLPYTVNLKQQSTRSNERGGVPVASVGQNPPPPAGRPSPCFLGRKEVDRLGAANAVLVKDTLGGALGLVLGQHYALAAVKEEIEEGFRAALDLFDEMLEVAYGLAVEGDQLQGMVLRKAGIDLILQDLGHDHHLLAFEPLCVLIEVAPFQGTTQAQPKARAR